MAEPYCGVVVNLYVFGRYISISTPNWTHDAPHRPSWLPKWQYWDEVEIPCELSKMFMLDWFFHFTMMWGPPTKRLLEMRDPQPIDPDDDDDDFDCDEDFEEEIERNTIVEDFKNQFNKRETQ